MAELIRLFLKQKSGAALDQQIEALPTLTRLRATLLDVCGHKPVEDRLSFLLADIGLENFAFVLVSEIINGCERLEPQRSADVQLDALLLALDNLEISAIEREESRMVKAELQKWGKLDSSSDREEWLRLRASLQRCRRLAENFGSRIFELFLRPAQKLGQALAVEEQEVRVFSESELRSHLVFQVSKLVSGMLRRVREQLKAPNWDVLVGGRAAGKLIALSNLEELRGNSSEKVIVLLNSAAGDEEVPKNVAALILAQEMPHLSHLGVRARQAGTVFVTCEEAAELEKLRGFQGQTISFVANAEGVSWEKAATSKETIGAATRNPVCVPQARLAAAEPWLLLENAGLETAGAKAAGVRRLTELSNKDGAGFEVPRGLVIPFGVMELAIAAAPQVERQYRELLDRLEHIPSTEVQSVTRVIRELVQGLSVPEQIVKQVAGHLSAESALIVRSSCNCEDLQDFAGAGLYESILNVRAAEVASAIRRVWCSLWTQRAVLTRREAGIPQQQAHMAVLIQQIVDAEFSFVLHTVNPISLNERELYAEIVVGLGETLVSGASQGTPYRLVCDKQSGRVVTLAFANFSQAARLNPGGGLKRETVDYSRVELSLHSGAREKMGKTLAAVGSFIERELARPHDIEGAFANNRVYTVQARPQTGLKIRNKT